MVFTFREPQENIERCSKEHLDPKGRRAKSHGMPELKRSLCAVYSLIFQIHKLKSRERWYTQVIPLTVDSLDSAIGPQSFRY
jgi:hypothetical protein